MKTELLSTNYLKRFCVAGGGEEIVRCQIYLTLIYADEDQQTARHLNKSVTKWSWKCYCIQKSFEKFQCPFMNSLKSPGLVWSGLVKPRVNQKLLIKR